MKKLLLAFPIAALLAAGCNSSKQTLNQTPASSSAPSVLRVVNTPQPPQPTGPVPEKPALQQFARVWKRYSSTRLGFSIDYPSDSFIPIDGLAHGDTYSVTFSNKNLSTGKIASNSVSYIEVDAFPISFISGLNDDGPYATTTLDGLPATKGLGQDSTAEFLLIHKGTQYRINIFTVAGTTGVDSFTSADIEHIRHSFKLN